MNDKKILFFYLRKKAAIVLVLLFSLISCDLNNVEDTDEITEACGTEDLSNLLTKNEISDKCKEVIQPLLPGPEDNLHNHIFSTGINSSEKTELLFSVTDDQGSLKDITVGDLTVIEINGEDEKHIQLTEESLTTTNDFGISLSLLTDYSASMSTSDIEEAVRLLKKIVALEDFTERLETNHIIFSADVETIFDFTEEPNIIFEESIERSSTSLYDGLGIGIETIQEQTNPVKVLILFSDGGENASSEYDYDDIVSLANQNNVLVILLGSLLSDLDFYKKYAADTGSIFIYARTINQLEENLQKAANLINQSNYKLTLENSSATYIRVVYEGQAIEYNLTEVN